MLTRDFMRPDPKTFYPTDTIKTVSQALYTFHENAAPVISENKMICGIVTRTDILRAVIEQLPMTCSIEKIMTKNVICAHPDDPLEEVREIPINSLPIVDNNKHVVGILYQKDYAGLYYHKYLAAQSTVKQLIEFSFDNVLVVDKNNIALETNRTDLEKGQLVRDEQLTKVIYTGLENYDEESGGSHVAIKRAPIFDQYKVVGAVQIENNDKIVKEKEKMHGELERNYEILKIIIESLKQGIIFVDTDNIIRLVNTAYEEIVGIPKEELLGHDAQEKIPNSRMHIVLKSGIAEIGSFQLIDDNGRQMIVDRVPIFKDGKIIGAIGEPVYKNIQEMEQILKRGKVTADIKQKPSRQEGKEMSEGSIDFSDIIGRAPGIVKAKNLAAKAAPTDATILITGESGTGKDIFAQAIHNTSGRAKEKFVVINCAAIPDALLESELFGYEEGAFTGARRGGKKGKLEAAEKGTLFLDEIGDMPFPMQAKILRVLQNKTFERVGGLVEKHCDVRIIAATNKNLKELVSAGSFREDLYYRMNVIKLHIPPLREREEDITELSNIFLSRLCVKADVAVKKISAGALQLMKSYNWPGNVRELINILEQITATVDSVLIQPKHLPEVILKQNWLKLSQKQAKDKDETELIRSALQSAAGNKVLAAKILGIHRSTLYEKIKKYNL